MSFMITTPIMIAALQEVFIDLTAIMQGIMDLGLGSAIAILGRDMGIMVAVDPIVIGDIAIPAVIVGVHIAAF